MTDGQNQLRNIKTFEELIRYLEDELDWPLSEFGFEDLTFEYSPSELGLKEEDAAKVRTIHQLRPLVDNQPWGIFFVEFENKRMPVVVLRRILSHLIVKKRVSSEKAYSASWHQGDLLFISAFGDEYSDQREIAFAHFHQEDGDLPTLRVLGWDGADTFLKLDHVVATLKERLCWPGDPSDSNAWRQQWSLAFRHRIGHVIRTADALAERLAELARGIRGAATTIMEHESENGALRRLHKAFQIALIHDLGEADFADTYAQTITYGLLTAAISRTEMSEGSEGTTLFAENVTDMVPITNPFLREMLQTFLQAGGRKGGIDFDELGIQNVVELLRGDETDLPAILRDFGNRTRGEDPVIHFYEHFLRAYDNELKIQRGVFYTPKPVVSYIVRSVHELLQTDFGLEDGLASTVTWAEIQEREADIRLPEGVSPDSPFVQILDPATGTATFLVEVIDIIHQTLVKKWIQKGFNEKQQQVAWNEYVVNHLLRCLHGYELMMAPYAIAHMKIGLKLYETGYRFGSDERVRIYLTNSLEPPLVEKQQLSFAEWAPALAHEAQSVNEIKRKQNYTIIIGNPPYSNYGMTNTGNWILNLIADYKKDINEKKINLNDDFIKFIRFGQYLLDQTGSGIFAMITNNSFLDGISHKEMRNSLANSYSSLNVLNLHGNLKRMEKTPEGNLDKNVFEIQPGVAISIFVKNPSHDIKPSVYYEDMWGDRDNKYKLLMRSTVNSNNWKKVELIPDRFFFIPKDFSNILEYEGYSKIDDIFIISQNGLKTDRDLLFYDDQKEKLEERVKQFYSDDGLSDEFRDLYNIHNSSSYDLVDRRDNTNYQADNIYKCLYRPFDIRWLYYSLGLTSRPASNAMKQMIANKNIAIVTGRAGQFIGSEEWDLVFCSEGLVDTNLFRRGGNLVLPLFTYKVNEESSNGQMKLEMVVSRTLCKWRN